MMVTSVARPWRGQLRRALLTAGALLLVPPSEAAGQSLSEIDEPAYQESASRQYWDFLRQTPCTAAGKRASGQGTEPNQNPDRLALLRRTGTPSTAMAGEVLDRRVVYRDSSYSIEFVRFRSRMHGVGSFGYWAQPAPNARGSLAPPVILVNGAGVTPAQAFGWRLPGDGSLVNVHDSSAFVGLGTALVEAGYAVLSIWLNDQRQFDPLSPWLILDRWGAAYRATSGEGGAYSLILPQVLAAVDFARAQPGIARGQVAIGGWEEGAQIAAVAAALDPRISAVVRLAPAVDWPAFRQSMLGIRHGASFTQMNCAIDDVKLDGLIAPRPLLHIASDDDPYARLYRAYQPPAIEATIRRSYRNARGAAPQFVRVRTAKQVSAYVVAFLDAAVRGATSTLASDRTPQVAGARAGGRGPKPVASEKYPFTYRDDQQAEVAKYIANTGMCPQVRYDPDFSSPEAYRQRIDALTDTLKALGGFKTGPAREPQQLISQRLLRRMPGYDLSYVRYRTNSGILDVEGLLATPHAGGTLPAVLSLNGNDGMKRNFDIPPFPPGAYLNGVADHFASRGHIVFVPYLPRWFPEIGSAVMRARDPGGQTAWSYLLPYYMSAVDILRGRADVDTARIGIFGISYAGDAAVTTAAFDPRISSVVYSNRSVDMRKAFSRSQDLAYRLVWSTDLCSLMDVELKMIAPRRFVWEAGDDPLFNDPNMPYIRGIQELYERLGSKSSFTFVRHSGGHETRPEGYRFFETMPPR